jgi:hypothetical protein
VAIELKREHERGSVQQMVEYLDGLAKVFPDRPRRGIIVSGREDQVGSAFLTQLTGYQVDWLCYAVRFDRVATTKKDAARV